MKTLPIPPGTAGVDTDARVAPQVALALHGAGKRYANRAIGHSPHFVAQNATAAEVRDSLHPAGVALGVLYTVRYLQRDEARDWSAETGKTDAEELIACARALLAELGVQARLTLCLDFETSRATAEQAWAYAKAGREALRVVEDAGEFDSGGYRSRSYPLTEAQWTELAFKHQWAAGDNARAPDADFDQRQGWPPAEIDGNQFDLDVVVANATGETPMCLAPDGWLAAPAPEPPAPPPLPPAPPPQPAGPDLSLRRLIPGESRLARVQRIAYAMSDPPDRMLLEPGVRHVPWTCECTDRAIMWHGYTLPEDGLGVMVTINGERFGGDPSARTARGFDASLLPYWGEVFGGALGHHGKPWPIASGSLMCTGAHVYMIHTATEIAPGVFECLCVDGGQVEGPVAPGTHSWHLDAGGAVVKEVVDDRRHGGHCQRYVRTLTRTADGSAHGYYACVRLGDWPLHEDGPAPPPKPADPPTVIVAPDPPPPPPAAPVVAPPAGTSSAQAHTLQLAIAGLGVLWTEVKAHWVLALAGVAAMVLVAVLIRDARRRALAKALASSPPAV